MPLLRVLEFVFKRPSCKEFKIGKKELGWGAAREGAGAVL